MRWPRGQGGFTLTELLVSLLVLAIVGNALVGVMLAMQRITRHQVEIAGVRGSLRSAFQLLQDELIELAPQDITEMSDQRIGYRAMRGLGETCELSSSTIRLRQSSYAGLRAPTAGRDGLWLYLDGDPEETADDRWVPLALSAVTPSGCPDGEAAWALSVALSSEDAAQALVPGPARTFETMELGQVEDSGQPWLGIRSVSWGEGSLVPVTGPLASDGLSFAYLDENDLPAATGSDVRTIVAILKGKSDRPSGVNPGGIVTPTDSLTLRVQLRN